jgi:nitrogen-specific signal transduction histidine kinase
MPDQAFSKIFSMAGPEIPARHQTLNHILISLLSHDLDQHQLVASIEAEPALLLQFLDGGNLQTWPSRIDQEACLERVLLLANGVQASQSGRAWQRSCLAAALVERLAVAASCSPTETHRFRLLAALLDIGHKQLSSEPFHLPREEQREAELKQFAVSGAELGAQILASRGFSARDCDVLRYQYEGLDVLTEASLDLLLVALAGRLADAMLTDFELAEHYFELIEVRLGIDSIRLRGSLEQAFDDFRLTNEALLGLDDFEASLARANLVAQIRQCQEQDSLVRIAHQLFDFNSVLFATAVGDELCVDVAGEQFSVPVNERASSSQISKAFQSTEPFSAEENALVAIVDKQIASRLATSALWLLPLGTSGVAICVPGPSDAEKDPFLLKVFMQSARAFLATSTVSTEAMIEVDQVQRRVRELTHEVNNPLAIVQNYLKTLSLKLGPESAVQPDIETISREMLRIGGIIQKYAEIGSETSETMHKVNLNELLQSFLGVFKGSHPDIVFQCDVDPNMPQVVSFADHLKQVVVNLVKNATEALEHTEDPHIWLATNARVNLGGLHYVEVIVQDNGPGIPTDIYQHLFSTNNSSKGGDHSGLGLSVANRLITDLGGMISCKTSATTGTQFQILLPIEQQSV